jgi:Na+/H+ antiporter
MTPVEQFEFVLSLLLLILGLSLVARRLHLPPAVAFILGGGALALIPGVPEMVLDPDLVIVLFLPPLLMSGAWSTVWREFRDNLSGIVLLAVGAVVFTTLLVGLVAHWILPELPWAVCFALGAIVSPPDAVAAEAVLERLSLPGRVTALLQGESLLNDAAGLVLFRFAVAAALTGSFSLGEAVITFGALSIGGVLVGVVIGFAGMAVLRRLRDTQMEITTTLLVPWGAYIGGEHLHVSGVLATVACGLLIGWYQHENMTAGTRVRAEAFWRVMVFVLESLVFILIGLSLRGVLIRLASAEDAAETLLWQVAAIVGAVIVSRFIWLFGSELLRRAFRLVRPGWGPAPSFAEATVMSWAGMRGVVSLAVALSLPEGLPGRDFILAATFGVILVTVLVQGTTLAPLIRWLGVSGDSVQDPRHLAEEFAWVRMAAAQHQAIVAASRQPDGTERHPRLLEQYAYRARVSASYAADIEAHRADAIEHFQTVLAAIAAGRAEVLRMHRAGEIHDKVLNSMERELDLQELSAELALE